MVFATILSLTSVHHQIIHIVYCIFGSRGFLPSVEEYQICDNRTAHKMVVVVATLMRVLIIQLKVHLQALDQVVFLALLFCSNTSFLFLADDVGKQQSMANFAQISLSVISENACDCLLGVYQVLSKILKKNQKKNYQKSNQLI